MNHGRSSEVDVSMAKSKIAAKCGQPTAAPDPVAVNRIHDRSNEEAVDHECRILPAFGHSTGRNCCGRIHKHHLEEEQCEYGHVIRMAAQEETCCSKQTERLSKECDRDFFVQSRITAHSADRAKTPKHDGESSHIEGKHSEGIDHEVHCHGVRHVLGSRQACFDHSKSSLHEHDKETGDQCPHHVYRDLTMAHFL